jgi:hypothetical protein
MNTEERALYAARLDAGLLDARHQPSVYYYRQAIRETRNRAEVVELAFALCRELERLRAWVRDYGLIPPTWERMETEIEEKPWLNWIPEAEDPEGALEVLTSVE